MVPPVEDDKVGHFAEPVMADADPSVDAVAVVVQAEGAVFVVDEPHGHVVELAMAADEYQ